MKALETIYEQFAPKKALERKKAQLELSYINRFCENSGYDESGASRRKNSLKGWRADSDSPQKDIDLNLPTLRRRSRSLYMGAPLARSAINSNQINVIGSGLIVKPRINYKVIGISKEHAKNLEQQMKHEFGLWAESKWCCSTHLNNFVELQQVALISWLLNGDCFALPIYDKQTPYMPYQLRIRLIEADRVRTPEAFGDYIDLNYKCNGNRVYSGVEISSIGAVVAYHICNSYPNEYETTRKWVRIPAVGERTGNPNVIHVFNAERAEQYRGVPYLAPVIETIKQMTRYTEAEIMAAVINGLFSVFITTEEGDDNVDFGGIEESEDEQEERDYQLGNGIVNYLKEGEDIKVADATRPNVNFGTFTDSMAKYIGAALDIPKDLLLKDFGKSYSASRAALLEAWKAFRMRRTWFADDFCQPIYELWLAEAVAKERIQAPGFFVDPAIRKAYCMAQWNGPAPGQLDPVKEATGAKIRLNNGLSTYERECVEINGSDFDYNVEQLGTELEKLRAIELIGGNDVSNKN